MAKTVYSSSELGSRINMIAERDIERGEVIDMNSIIGVSLNSIREGSEGIMLIEGIFMMEKTSPEDSFLIGSAVFLDSGKASLAGDTYMGRCVDVSSPGETEVLVKINTGQNGGGTSAELLSPDNTRRIRYRDGSFVTEATITPLGFAGVENTDWELISNL